MTLRSLYKAIFYMFVQCILITPVNAETEQTNQKQQTMDHSMHHKHNMQMNMDSMVMNENTDQLPRGCTEISEDVDITVKAGRKFASKMNGIMFAYDQGQWNVKPCSRIHVTFINEDKIRHQFMMHQLPPSIYPPYGMFNIEVTGPGQRKASFIVPNVDQTYLVHCDVAQHTENGLKAQLVVGKGSEEDLPSIPGITPPTWANNYVVKWTSMSYTIAVISAIGSILVGLAMWFGLKRLVRGSVSHSE